MLKNPIFEVNMHHSVCSVFSLYRSN